MFKDVVSDAKGNKEPCEHTDSFRICSQMSSRSLVFLGDWIRRKTVRNLNSQTRWIMGSNGRRNDDKFLSIRSSDSSCFQCLCERRITKQRRRCGKKSTHFNGSHETIVLLLCTVISSNQISIYVAVTVFFCDEVPKRFRAPVKPEARDHLETMEIPTDLSIAENFTNKQQWRNLRQYYERRFEHLTEDWKLSKLCSDAGLKLVERERYFCTLEIGQQMQRLCREHTLPRRGDPWERMDSKQHKNRSSLVGFHVEQYSVEVQVPSLFQDNTVSWVRSVRHVTESMLTTKEVDIASEKPIALAIPRQMLTVTWLQFLFLFLKGYGSSDQTVNNVLKCQKAITRLKRHDQSVPRGIDGAIQYNDTIEECRRKKFDNASQWLLKIGYQNWQRLRSEEKIPILCESKLSQPIPELSSNSRKFKRKCCWSCTARQ